MSLEQEEQVEEQEVVGAEWVIILEEWDREREVL